MSDLDTTQVTAREAIAHGEDSTDEAPVHQTEPAGVGWLALEAPDLEGLEFLLDEIEDQIAPLA